MMYCSADHYWASRRRIQPCTMGLYGAPPVQTARCAYTIAFFSALTAQQRHQLTVLDKRCVRCVANLLFPSHTTPIYTRLSLTPVIERAKCKLRFLMHRVHTSSISPLLKDRVALQPPSNTRGNDNCKYVVPLTRRTSGDSRPLVSAVKLWNTLPQELTSARRPTPFKRLLKVFFYG